VSPERAGAEPEGGRWTRGTLALRLTLGYALLFALSATALFGLTYAVLLGSMREQDRALSATYLRLYADAYARGGLAGVHRAARSVQADDRGEESLVRVADAANRTLLLLPPEDWTPEDFAALERPGAPSALENGREDQELDVVALRLPDGARLQVGVSSDERDDVQESFPRVFLAISLPLLLLSLLGGAFMAQRALSPIRHLLRALRAIIATGDVRERAPEPPGRGEMAELFRLFNRMLDRIEGLMDRLRGTLDDVAHDLRTPMTRLRGTAEVALAGERDAVAYREALADTLEAAETITATLDAVMDVAETEAGTVPLRREPVALADLARDVAELYALVAEEKGVALEVTADDPAETTADRGRLRRALANLVDNAVKYTPPGGRVVLRTFRDGQDAAVEVRDTGLGIPEEERPRIWDRHFRGDRSRSERGLGLGLSLVRAIVEAHGGRVGVESAPGAGATFTLRLPPSGPPG
jgi:heavy metal sensor kinase